MSRTYTLGELQRLVDRVYQDALQSPRAPEMDSPPAVLDVLHELGIKHERDEDRTMPRKY